MNISTRSTSEYKINSTRNYFTDSIHKYTDYPLLGVMYVYQAAFLPPCGLESTLDSIILWLLIKFVQYLQTYCFHFQSTCICNQQSTVGTDTRVHADNLLYNNNGMGDKSTCVLT